MKLIDKFYFPDGYLQGMECYLEVNPIASIFFSTMIV